MQTNFSTVEIDTTQDLLVNPQECIFKDKFSIVISRYNENLDWIKTEIPDELCITIYNKGKDNLGPLPANYKQVMLPNFGHESQTYLYHIVNNYDSLAERTLFLQGYPFDHPILKPFSSYFMPQSKVICNNIYAKCDPNRSLIYESNVLKKVNWTKSKWNYTTVKTETMKDFAEKVFHIDISKMRVGIAWGANFAVDRENILCHTKEFHQNILNSYNSTHPLEDHYMERLWDIWADCSIS